MEKGKEMKVRSFISTAIVLTSGLINTATADDRFEEIRGKWVQCAACHGPEGQGGIGPMLAGRSADNIIDKLLAYKRGEYVGAQSTLMWPQAQGLTDGQIGLIGVFVQEGFPES
jgi:cytochrome c553